MRKTIITTGVVAIVIFLIALPKLNLFGSRNSSPQPAGNPGAPPPLPVQAVIITPSRLDNRLIFTGSILPNESLELKAEASGKISKIYFEEGRKVKKGQLLLEINDDELVAQLEKQKHNRKLNQDIEFRQRKLLEKDAISQEEYDNALNRLNTTIADIKLLEAQLAKTRIYAPFDGTIGFRFVSEGAYISPSTTVATLYNLNPAKIEFNLPGRYSTQVRAGKKVRFTVENDPRTFEGEVYAVEPQIDVNTRTLKVRALASNPEGLLLPGQFVRVELILETIENALLVPSEALIPDLQGHKVFVNQGGKAAEQRVEIGLRTDRQVEILSGLEAGDTVITTGILQLRPGAPVSVSLVNPQN
ncbi:MAG: MexH family multidrug efflux RND transporter periplasmic adaptor subunit [Cyclobacteriaceae bacterium]|nr:MAG: MexH family multidrug efflux RND transporter periplasmic adaptor subunit [Cyclobacteriaceae bacterium]